MKEKIRKLIEKGNIEKAIDLLPITNDTLLLKARFKRNKTDNMRGIVSRTDYEIESNRMLYAVIDIINDEDFEWGEEEEKPIISNGNPIKTEGKKVFLSYSHQDEAFKDALDVHFAALKRSGKINTWNDRSILAGENWDEVILTELRKADIILLLISADFIASNYIWDKELPIALQRQKEGKCKIVPVIVRHCMWQSTEFAELQGLPKNGKPIASYEDKDQAYLEVVNGINAIIEG